MAFLKNILVYLHAFEEMRKSTGGGRAGVLAIFQIIMACSFARVSGITASFIIIHTFLHNCLRIRTSLISLISPHIGREEQGNPPSVSGPLFFLLSPHLS